jgi:hypothetical protein
MVHCPQNVEVAVQGKAARVYGKTSCNQWLRKRIHLAMACNVVSSVILASNTQVSRRASLYFVPFFPRGSSILSNV